MTKLRELGNPTPHGKYKEKAKFLNEGASSTDWKYNLHHLQLIVEKLKRQNNEWITNFPVVFWLAR